MPPARVREIQQLAAWRKGEKTMSVIVINIITAYIIFKLCDLMQLLNR